MSATIDDFEEFQFDLINTFILHYQKANKKDKLSLLDGVDASDSTATNHMMEMLYDAIFKYKTNKEAHSEMIKLYNNDEVNVKDYEEVYGLYIDDKLNKVSPSLFSIIIHITEEMIENSRWHIINLKSS